MSGGCAYSQDMTAKQAAKRLRGLADQLQAGGIVHLSVAFRFDRANSRMDYYGAGYKPLGGAGDLCSASSCVASSIDVRQHRGYAGSGGGGA